MHALYKITAEHIKRWGIYHFPHIRLLLVPHFLALIFIPRNHLTIIPLQFSLLDCLVETVDLAKT